MRIFKSKEFARFARKERIADDVLIEAVRRAEAGAIDADLGGGVIKQRIARHGQGKRGGYRTIMFWRKASRSIFVYGFAKSGRDNISDEELRAFRTAAGRALLFNDDQIANLMATRAWLEIEHEDEI